ncbi:hypothetical protein [Phaeospirillum tilakii]|uniref:Uncharacterized protein n=1 Tax=Phaeospirillum tilakii TaxID=741673 RepID=A0ABW5C9E7_9PROT
MIEEILVGTTASLLVGLIGWRTRRLHALQEQLEFVRQFADARRALEDDPTVPEAVKKFLRFSARIIDSPKTAQYVFSTEPPTPSARRAPVLQAIRAMTPLQQERFRAATRCLLMALSYYDGKSGAKLRAALSGARSEKAIRVEMAKIVTLEPLDAPGLLGIPA